MKIHSLAPLCLLLACSSPKYIYKFPEPQSATVIRKAPVSKAVELAAQPVSVAPRESPAVYSANVASPMPTPRNRTHRVERKPVVQRTDPLPMTNGSKAPPADVHLKGDLMRAVIFAAFGGIALLIGGQFFVVTGTLSLLIGLIFGIKWFVRR